MEDNLQNDDVLTIDLGQLFALLKKNMRLMILSALICGIIAFVFTSFLLPKKYASESSIYLVPKVNTETGTVDYNTVTANSKQVNNYMVMIKGENILSLVAKNLSIENVNEVMNSISVSNTANTEIIKIKATTDDPVKSQKIVNETINTFFEQMKTNLKIENMTVLNDAKVNEVPVSPNKKINTLVGVLLGLLGSGGYVLLTFMLDKRLRTKTEAENFLGIPVLAEIPFYED